MLSRFYVIQGLPQISRVSSYCYSVIVCFYYSQLDHWHQCNYTLVNVKQTRTILNNSSTDKNCTFDTFCLSFDHLSESVNQNFIKSRQFTIPPAFTLLTLT